LTGKLNKDKRKGTTGQNKETEKRTNREKKVGATMQLTLN
jgi:hypothetical protein